VKSWETKRHHPLGFYNISCSVGENGATSSTAEVWMTSSTSFGMTPKCQTTTTTKSKDAHKDQNGNGNSKHSRWTQLIYCLLLQLTSFNGKGMGLHRETCIQIGTEGLSQWTTSRGDGGCDRCCIGSAPRWWHDNKRCFCDGRLGSGDDGGCCS
jgi:hypothetical protein